MDIANIKLPKGLDEKFVTRIGDQYFYIEIWMYNNLQKFNPIPINFFMVENLTLNKSLNNWYTSGSIVLKNDLEILERGALSVKLYKEKSDQIEAPFFFRNDAKNKIYLKILPIQNPADPDTFVYYQDLWEISHEFVVYETKDVDAASTGEKMKMFSFVDERYQIFLERNVEWSTAIHAKGETDQEKSMMTSLAIQSLIRTAASETSDPRSPAIQVGSSDGPKGIKNPNLPMYLFDYNDWDIGSEDSNVLYTSPANSSVLDDLDYLMGNIKANDGTPVFLMLDDYDREGGKLWHLVPLSKIFKDAKKNQTERLIIEDGVDMSSSAPYLNRAPMVDGDRNNFHSAVASRILHYEYIPMECSDNMSFVNSPVHYYDFSKNEFNIEVKGNTAKEFVGNFKQKIKGSLFSLDRSDQILLNINKTKQKGLSVSNKHVTRRFFPKNMSFVNMVRDFVLLNQTIRFVSKGLTMRKPGNFVFIDRLLSNSDINPFDDKVLGQWLLVSVEHQFTKEDYVNNVIATKVDAFNKWFEEVDTIELESYKASSSEVFTEIPQTYRPIKR